MHAAAPAALWAAWGDCTCAGAALLDTFFSELKILASLLLCACAFDSPIRPRKPAFTTREGSALQHRGPSPGGVSLLGFSGPAAPRAILTRLLSWASFSAGDWLVSGAYALTRKRLTGRLCWSMMVSRVAICCSFPRLTGPWPQGNGYALGPAGAHLRCQSVLEERGALVLPHFATRLPRLLEHRGEQPPFLVAKDDLVLLAHFFQTTQVLR
jgi:hypothetical protein